MKILTVDLQNDFASEGGVHYGSRPCMPFIKETFLPFVSERGYTIDEIASDYRATGGGNDPSVCAPGTWGYQSILPTNIQHRMWVKAEPSPAWVREGGGIATSLPGAPYPAPDDFSAWLSETLGPPDPQNDIVLLGLTLEICVLSTLQELHFRGYRVKVLFEGVDTYSGALQQKKLLFEMLFPFWGQGIFWNELCQQL